MNNNNQKGLLSVYTQVYNTEKYDIDYISPLKNYFDFLEDGDEIVIAINQSEDDTYHLVNDAVKRIKALKSDKKINIVTIPTDFSYSDIEFDGKVKNEALQASRNPIKIQMDIDEYFDLNQVHTWRTIAEDMLVDKFPNCYLIPSIDVWGEMSSIRKNVVVGRKFRMHQEGYKRGVPNFAWNDDKTINTEMSDSTELVDENNNIVLSHNIVPDELLLAENCYKLPIYTIHTGYLNFKYREKINTFWNPHWEARCGGRKKDVPQTTEKLKQEETIEHKLKFKL